MTGIVDCGAMTDTGVLNNQDRDHILIFSMGQHSYGVYFEAISTIRPSHVFFISNKEIIDAGKEGKDKYSKLCNTDTSLTSNPGLEELFEFQKKYTNPFFEGSTSITPLQIDGLIVTKALDVIKETQKIINELHSKEGKDLVNVIKKREEELTYLLENSFLREIPDIRSIPEDDFEKYDFGHKLREKLPPVIIAEIQDKGMGYTHIIVDDSNTENPQHSSYKKTVREAISDALVEYSSKILDFAKPCNRKRVKIGAASSGKWNNPKYSFHISAGRNKLILHLYTIAMWLDADVYLSPHESGLQLQQLPGMGSPLTHLSAKDRYVFRQLLKLSSDKKTTDKNGYVPGHNIYDDDTGEYLRLYRKSYTGDKKPERPEMIGALRQDFSRCSERFETKGYVESKRWGKNKHLKLTDKGIYICSIIEIHDSYE